MLRIYLAGDLAIEHGTVLVREDLFPGMQGRVAFTLLAAEHARAVTRDELEAELWPDEPPAAVDVAVRALLSKLRGTIAAAGLPGGTLTHAFGAYRLRLPPGAWVDVLDAFDAIHRAEPSLREGDLDAAVGFGRVAVSVASRPFVPGAEGPWVSRTRERLRDVLLRALDCLAEAWLTSGDAGQAARDAEHAVALDPYREQSHRLLMRALDADGNRAGALRAYERLREHLADELGADPSPETQALHLDLLRSA